MGAGCSLPLRESQATSPPSGSAPGSPTLSWITEAGRRGAASPFSCREFFANSRRTHPCRLDVFGKTEAAGQRGVGEEGDLVDLAAAQGEHHHARGLRAQVVAEGRLAVGARRA